MNFSQNITPRQALWVLLSLLFLLRLSMIGRGANAFGDETRYWYSAQFLLALSQGDWHGAVEQFFQSNARPLLLLLNLPPVILQSAVYKLTALDPRSPDSLLIPQVWFVGCSVLQCLVFQQLAQRWAGLRPWPALLLTLCYGLLPPCNFYLRHLLPFDAVLLCWLWFLPRISHEKNPAKVGFVTACLLLAYPGWWSLGLLSLFLFGTADSANLNLRALAKMLLGGLAPLVFFELLARWVARSLLDEGLASGAEYVQYLPDRHGALALLYAYLANMIGPVALALSAAWVWVLYEGLKRRQSAARGPLFWAIVALSLGFAAQATLGWIMGWQVFYGRLFYPFLPFALLALGRCWAARQAALSPLRLALFGVFFLVLGAKFFYYYLDYQALAYPRDVLYRLGFRCAPTGPSDYDIWSEKQPNDGLTRLNAYAQGESYATIPPGPGASRPIGDVEKKWVLLHFSLPPRIAHEKAYSPAIQNDSNAKWLLRQPHFFSHQGYWFEENYWGKRAYFGKEKMMLGVMKRGE